MKTHKVYAVQRLDGLVKIGTTTNLKARLEALTKSHGALAVLRIVNGGRRLELKLHREFREHHEFGEWFRPSVVVLLASIEEGEVVSAKKGQVKANWEAGEQAYADAAHAKLRELVALRQSRSRCTAQQALQQIADEHAMPKSFLEHLFKGKALTISAYGYKAINAACLAEMETKLAELNDEIARLGGAE